MLPPVRCSDFHLLGLLRDWDATVSLLLKESEVFSSGHALSAFHSAALLRLLLESARGLHARLAESGESLKNSWIELQSTLGSALARLFTRFGDDERNLLVLSLLLPYMDAGRATASSGCLKITAELFARCRDEALLFNLCTAWSGWAAEARAEGGSAGQAVSDCVRRAAVEQWTLLEEHRLVLEERAGAAVVGRKMKKGNTTPLEVCLVHAQHNSSARYGFITECTLSISSTSAGRRAAVCGCGNLSVVCPVEGGGLSGCS